MKKYLLFALAAMVALVFSACSEEGLPDGQSEELVDVTYSISTSSQTSTRAAHDDDGKAANINRYICEVWHVNADNTHTLYKRVEKVVPNGVQETNITLRLVALQSYKVLFWADHAEVYGTGVADGYSVIATDLYYETNALKPTKGLKEVSIISTTDGYGNPDEMDAFYGTTNIDNLKGSISRTVTLTRPFAQLNVITTDIRDIVDNQKKPNKVTLSVNAPSKFNVMTGTVSEPTYILYTDVPYYKRSGKNAMAGEAAYSFCTLAMSNIFASENEKDIVTVHFEAGNGGTVLASKEFSNVHLQRNFRTNIIGRLLTDDEYYNESHGVQTIEDANDALTRFTNIVITNPEAAATLPITFPVQTEGKDITLTFDGEVGGGTLTFKNEDGTKCPKSVTIVAPAGTNLTFVKATHVVLNGTNYGIVEGSFSDNTLVISEGVTIQKLIISAGSIEIHGTLKDIEFPDGSTAKVKTSENLDIELFDKISPENIAEGFEGVKNDEQGNTWNVVSVNK